MPEPTQRDQQHDSSDDDSRSGLESRDRKVEEDAEEEDGEVEGWEVVVKEELTFHEVEGSVMKGPGEEEEGEDGVVGEDES